MHRICCLSACKVPSNQKNLSLSRYLEIFLYGLLLWNMENANYDKPVYRGLLITDRRQFAHELFKSTHELSQTIDVSDKFSKEVKKTAHEQFFRK